MLSDMTGLHPLKNGILGVFAPSSPFDEVRFERGAARLEAAGLKLIRPEALHARYGYLAGTDDHRVQAFHDLLDDPEIEGLIAARGGYGVHRLLERIDYERVRASQKLIVGFSDITALLLGMWTLLEQPGLHGPVVTQLGDLSPECVTHLVHRLRAPDAPETFSADGVMIGPGRASGRLLGGCLSVITPLIGSPYCPDFRDAILLLEDVGEYPYHIDRLLTGLRLSGILDQVAGIALGDFVGCDPPRPNEPSIEAVLLERLGTLGIPVMSGFPFGHGARNRTVPIGLPAVLDANEGTLTVGG